MLVGKSRWELRERERGFAGCRVGILWRWLWRDVNQIVSSLVDSLLALDIDIELVGSGLGASN